MFANPAWTVDVTRVLTRRELATVLADAKAQAEHSLNAQRNLIIVRLACCCGLRVSDRRTPARRRERGLQAMKCRIIRARSCCNSRTRTF
jgi:hypothetical protein